MTDCCDKKPLTRAKHQHVTITLPDIDDQPMAYKEPMPLDSDRFAKDHLIRSVVNLLCCCICFSLPALYFSIKTRDMNYQGEVQMAREYSRKSDKFNSLSTIVGIFFTGSITIIYYLWQNGYLNL